MENENRNAPVSFKTHDEIKRKLKEMADIEHRSVSRQLEKLIEEGYLRFKKNHTN